MGSRTVEEGALVVPIPKTRARSSLFRTASRPETLRSGLGATLDEGRDHDQLAAASRSAFLQSFQLLVIDALSYRAAGLSRSILFDLTG